MELQELKAFIREAFQDVEYPGDDNIAGCSRSLLPQGCYECDGIAAHFKGTTWQEHTPQTLSGYDDTLSLFHLGARHYYLPAFMLAELETGQSEELWDLLPNLDISHQFYRIEDESSKEFIALLSKSQRRAVVEYFKFLNTDEDGYRPSAKNINNDAIYRKWLKNERRNLVSALVSFYFSPFQICDDKRNGNGVAAISISAKAAAFLPSPNNLASSKVTV